MKKKVYFAVGRDDVMQASPINRKFNLSKGPTELLA